MKEVVAAVHGAGGLAILAHPGDRLPADEWEAHLLRLVQWGLDGVECYYPAHDPAYTRACRAFCDTYGLCVTAGCDDHGGFAERVGDVHYTLGALSVDTDMLRLGKLI
jgi:hypothetical protein